MGKKLYIGQDALNPIATIITLEKNIRTIQNKMQTIELKGLPGEQLMRFYTRKLEIQCSMLNWFTEFLNDEKS